MFGFRWMLHWNNPTSALGQQSWGKHNLGTIRSIGLALMMWSHSMPLKHTGDIDDDAKPVVHFHNKPIDAHSKKQK